MAKSKKQKRPKYIRKILSDGKVSKKEVRKAEKKGIRLSRITSAAEKATRAGNPFSGAASSPVRFAGANKTKTTPAPAITIASGAQKLVDRDTARRAAAEIAAGRPQGGGGADAGAGTDTGAGAGTDGATDAIVNPLQGELDAALSRIGDLEGQLSEMPDFATIFAEQANQDAANRRADMEAARQQQALYMEEMAARQAEQERQRLLTSQTQQANMARSGLTPDFRIGGRRTDFLGTGGFKRRRRIRPATIAQGIAPTAAVAAGATTGNLLNV